MTKTKNLKTKEEDDNHRLQGDEEDDVQPGAGDGKLPPKPKPDPGETSKKKYPPGIYPEGNYLAGIHEIDTISTSSIPIIGAGLRNTTLKAKGNNPIIQIP